MADVKISALPASTTPLAGTEVLPVVQSGVTKKVSVADLTTGRSVSASELTVSSGNVIIGTSGNGIDFSATASGSGTMTSELLNDYEEGTFTPIVFATTVPGVGTYTTQTGRYTKIGNCVYFYARLAWTAHTASGPMYVGQLPYTTGSQLQCNVTCEMSIASGAGTIPVFQMVNNNTIVQLLNYNVTSGALGTISLPASSSLFIIQGYYFV